MTLWQIEGIYEYWQKWPPVHWLIGSYFGFKGKHRERAVILRGPAAEEKNREGVEALMRFMDQTGPSLRQH